MRKSNFMFLLPVLAFMSCSEDSINPQTTEEQILSTEEILANTEVAYPNETGPVSEVYFAGQKIAVAEIDGEYVYQGDILFSPDMLTSQPVKLIYEEGEALPSQKSVGRTSGKWPENTVYFAVDKNLPSKDRVYDAIDHWEENTPLKFIESTSETNYIYFTSGSGCSSYVGRIGGRQKITLASSCSTGNTIHEIGHAVGLWHEQSRVDRDNHIKINFSNIRSGMAYNFKTYAANGFDGEEFTSSLDFGSIMMYGPYSFSKNGSPTIVKTNGSTYSIQRNVLSAGDIEGISSMYPGKSGVISYINGEYYTVSGLTVLRHNNVWYALTRYGWRKVKLVNDNWYYA